jgi:hypothetical protein
MPDRALLRVGDRIRLLAVPAADLRQREREVRAGVENAGWTADTIERILEQDPVVVIAHIDEYGIPWFDYELRRADGKTEFHTLSVIEDESWSRK